MFAGDLAAPSTENTFISVRVALISQIMATAKQISEVMAELGRIKSKKKAAASKANGKKGGRPKGKSGSGASRSRKRKK